ncbi:MAG: heavy-metal-associated domain-containing protein [Actinomycetota bacterium]|nr:heavy-metal-associated domain-containing protein [Actinomycetota bacterium]
MITKTLKVHDIHCSSCENTIQSALSTKPGVIHVVASAERNDVRVSFDDAAIGEAELRELLKELGYEPLP